MRHRFAIFVGILAIAIFAAVVTELSLGLARQTANSPDKASIRVVPTPTPSPTSSTTTTSSPVPSAPPRTAVTNGFVHLRAATSTSSADLVDLPAGTTLEVTGPTQGLWQPVTYQGQSGYVYTSYLNY